MPAQIHLETIVVCGQSPTTQEGGPLQEGDRFAFCRQKGPCTQPGCPGADDDYVAFGHLRILRAGGDGRHLMKAPSRGCNPTQGVQGGLGADVVADVGAGEQDDGEVYTGISVVGDASGQSVCAQSALSEHCLVGHH